MDQRRLYWSIIETTSNRTVCMCCAGSLHQQVYIHVHDKGYHYEIIADLEQFSYILLYYTIMFTVRLICIISGVMRYNNHFK